MKVAIVIAGGVGTRTQQNIPKQFINVCDKPIIIYTLEQFQKHDEIDAIEAVCLQGWETILEAYAQQFGIAKLRWIVPGGVNTQESIYNGLRNLEGKCKKDDIVIIHDGIRPMVENLVISSCIEVCEKYGNGISALPVYEQIFKRKDEVSTDEYIRRDDYCILQTPQAYYFDHITECYRKGFDMGVGIGASSYANTLMTDLGYRLYFSMGSTKNIKITTKEDIEIFRAMLRTHGD